MRVLNSSMKKLLVLAGNSVQNREWGEACAGFFRTDFDLVFFPHYDHWSTGAQNMNLAAEVEKIRETVTESDAEGEWYIFAKSIGSVLALKTIQQGVIKPEKCVFFGMSLNIAATLYGEDRSYLSECDVPALAFHNNEDPTAEYGFVVEKLRTLAPTITLRTIEGNTHDYLDFHMYAPEIKEFLAL